MRDKNFSRLASLFTIFVMLFMTSSPFLTFAGGFIGPGQPMKPGQAVKGGTPLTGGQFIVPGQVYTPGETVKGGNGGSTSGQPIMSGDSLQYGLFIIPNAPITTGSYNWIVNPLDPGSALNGGQGINGGEGPSGGQGMNSGEGPSGGQGMNGGEGPNGGQGMNGGEGPSGGQGMNGGEGPSGSQSMNGGEGPSGRQGMNGGEGPSGSQGMNGGEGPSGSQSMNGGEGPNGGQGMNGGANPEGNSSNSWMADVHEAAKQAKKVFITYPRRFGEMLDGTLSLAAGFKVTNLNTATGNKNLFKIVGRTTFTNVNPNNPLTMWLNVRYQNYLESFENKKLVLRNNTLRTGTDVRVKKISPFIKEQTSFKSVLSKVGKDFSKNWNPFSNPFNSANKGIGKVMNKEFFKVSNMAKGNGLANVILSTGGRIIDYATDPKKSFRSTDFAAGITTDVAFGVGATAISAGAGWMATAAAFSVAGSVVPGLGTVVGAAAGIAVGLFLETDMGKNIKGRVEKGVKKVFDGAKKWGSSLKSRFSGVFG